MKELKSLWTSVFMNMPPAVRGLLMVFTVGGVAGIIYALHLFGVGGPVLYWSLTIGVIVIALLGGVFVGIAKWRKKSRAKAAGEVIKDSAGGAEGVSSADEIARLDQLRKDWDAAVRKFEENNDDGLYSLPWYLLVGEPGSGKTEAIRHSGIPFPTGLNKPNQGTGGTYNMDWWFANDAIIIDTAGRLLFNETREWTELLKRLGKLRPHCPINGMLLVIPTDSLLKDSSHEIETKASRIAEQINSIKRELGIRFPVFVLITKSDYITGFREYFSHLDDPALEHQMLGWSNPHALDEPFNPDLVDEHLDSVSQRLIRRRTAMLLDPPLVDESSDRTTDQVDALYAFPEEIKRIKNRLRLYMEQIFTPGPWSKKPPFIRGIYFTSSMQEGKELDTALAELLNIDVSELPKGRVWNRDTAYFLRDLFTQKVFPEKGLVTRAVNAAQNYRRNKLIVNGIGLAAILLSLAFGAKALWDFNRGINQPQQWWSAIAKASDKSLPALIASESGGAATYQGQQLVEMPGGTYTLAQLLEESGKAAGNSIAPRGLLRPIAFFSAAGGIDESARQTNARLFKHVAIAPLAVQAQQKFDRDDRQWSREAAPALAQLLHMARLAYLGSGNDAEQGPQIEPLLRFAFESDDPYRTDVQSLQRAVDMAYSSRGYPGIRDRSLRVQDHAAIMKAAEAGIERWGAHWSSQIEGEDGLFADLVELKDAIEAFQSSEEEMLAIVAERDDCPNVADHWQASYPALHEARQRLDKAAAAFDGGGSILDSVKSQMQAFLDDTRREYELLAGQLPEDEQVEEPLSVLRQRLTGVWEQVQAAHVQRGEALVQAIGVYENDHLAAIGDSGLPVYAARSDKYRLINAEMVRQPEGGIDLLSLETAVAAVDERIANLRSDVLASNRRPGGRPQSNSFEGFVDSMLRCGCESAEQVQKQRYFRSVSLPTSEREVADLVRSAAGEQDFLPALQLTSTEPRQFDGRYDIETVGTLVVSWSRISEGDAESDVVSQRHMRAMQEYLAAYITYWTERVPDEVRVRWPGPWETYRHELINLRRSSINERLELLIEQIRDALAVLRDVELFSDDAKRITRFNESLRHVQLGHSVSEEVALRWASIGDSAQEAQRRLLALTPTQFHDFFPNVDPRPEGPRPLDYWSQVAYEGLRLVADAAGGRCTEARAAFEGPLRAFPLCRDAGTELRADQLQGAREHMNSFVAVATGTSGRADTLGGGALQQLGLRRTLIDRMRGHECLAGVDNQRVQQLRQLIYALDSDVDFDMGGDERNIETALIFRQVELWSEGRMLKRWIRAGQNWPNDAVALSPWQHQSLELRFYRQAIGVEEADEAVTIASGGWPLARAVLSSQAEESPDGRRRAPLQVGAHTVWISIATDSGTSLPPRDAWPRIETWPF